MTSADETKRMRWLRTQGFVRNGELTPRGERYAEEQYEQRGRDEDDDRDEPEPYPDSNLY